MGLSLGEEDERFGCHEKYYEQAEESGDIHVIENVPEYPVKSMVDRFLNHGDENGPWKCEYAQVDPRLFGFSTARPRVYGLAWNSNVVQWDPKFEFLEILECLKESNLRDYLSNMSSKVRPGWQVADLCQLVRTGRARTDTVDNHLMTITTNSTRLYSKDKGRYMSSKELLSSHVFPVTQRHSKKVGSPMLQIDTTEGKAAKMAGNSMNIPTMGAFVLAAVLGLS
ncbi:unnamed protein product [Cladocopium goreaui]|uniref:PABC domain-containing protein n=1 Tax=Cladocopium goreaui TaxID=2562237 RepID=A0A9P1GMR6_9DINO|nr:unnamed protein product [Cladocopium goreaui]